MSLGISPPSRLDLANFVDFAVVRSSLKMPNATAKTSGLDPATEVALDYWKERPVRPTDIPFKCAVETVGTADAWVEFRQQAPARWVVRPST